MAEALTILFIDDDETEQHVVKHVFKAAGYVLVQALNAEEGLAKVNEEKPDLILLDYMLPDLDGLTVLKRLAAESASYPPVVIVTGQGSEMVAVEAMKAGAIDYVVKDVQGAYLHLLPAVISRAHASFVERNAARRLNELNNAILRTVADGILGVGDDGGILFANPAAERMLRSPGGGLVGRRLSEFLRQAGVQGARESHPLLQASSGSTTLSGECDFLQPASGAAFPAAYNASALDFEESGHRGWVLAFQDITERKAAEEQLRRHKDQLEIMVQERTADLLLARNAAEAANREMAAFSYSLSHDMRTPLRAINGFVAILLEEYRNRLDQEGQRRLEAVRRSTVRMGNLIDGLVEFIHVCQFDMKMAEVDMGALTRKVFQDLRPAESPERSICLRLGELPPANCDERLIRSLLNHLLGNAIKFTSPRTEAVIEVGASVEGAHNVYSVKDNGVGFDMRYADQLFSVICRLHATDEFEGAGVGLAVVKRIVERHGGRVWAEGAVDQGATFHFTLPRKVQASDGAV
jgi:PAS domain S-box-containing protein